MTESEKNLRLGRALVALKGAWSELTEASKALPDFNIGEAYPFYLLDFETIDPAVSQWCTVNANKLFKLVQAEVDIALIKKEVIPDVD